MSDQSDTYLNLVNAYGLSDEEGRIYLYLLAHGFQSALNLSRNLKIARTKIYRLLDKLKSKQVIEFRLSSRGMEFGAVHPAIFRQLLEKKQQELHALSNTLPDLITQLSGLITPSSPHSKVLYYSGKEGIEQLSYNITQAKDLLRVYEVEHLSEFIDPNLAEQIRSELVKNKVMTHDLTNKLRLRDFTQVTQMISRYSQFRHLPPTQLKIQFEVLIYNDIYATYTYQDEDWFGVEIHNPELAAMQKQLFDFVWQQAWPMRFTSAQGAATIGRKAKWKVKG